MKSIFVFKYKSLGSKIYDISFIYATKFNTLLDLQTLNTLWKLGLQGSTFMF